MHLRFGSDVLLLLLSHCCVFGLLVFLLCPHLSAGQGGVSDLLSHLGEDGDEPALTVKLLAESSTGAAQQGGQQVLIASAELAVLQVVLQQPDKESWD